MQFGSPEDRSSILAEAREKLRQQRSEDRNISDRHYRTRAAWECTMDSLEACRGLHQTLSTLIDDVGGAYDALNAANEADVKEEIARLEEQCAAEQRQLGSLKEQVAERAAAELEAARGLEAARAEMERVVRETAEMEALGDTALQLEQELAAVVGEKTLRAKTLGTLQTEAEKGAALLCGLEAQRPELQHALQDAHAEHSTQAAALSHAHTAAHLLKEGEASHDELLAVERRKLDAALAQKRDEADDWKQRHLRAVRVAERRRGETHDLSKRIAEATQRLEIADRKQRILRRRDEIADAVAAQQRYKAEIHHLERELSQRPTAAELPGRCRMLEQQCETLCEELNHATEDLQLLQCGMAESRYTEMSLAFDAYKNETIPAVQKRCYDLRGEVHNKKVAQRMWEEERERHGRFDAVLRDDLGRLHQKLGAAEAARASREAEEESWAQERLQWDEQRRVWGEEDESVAAQIRALEAGGEEQDVVIEVIEEHLGRDNIRTTKRRIIVQPAAAALPGAIHAEALKGQTPASGRVPKFDFFAVKLLSNIARAVRRPFQRAAKQSTVQL